MNRSAKIQNLLSQIESYDEELQKESSEKKRCKKHFGSNKNAVYELLNLMKPPPAELRANPGARWPSKQLSISWRRKMKPWRLAVQNASS